MRSITLLMLMAAPCVQAVGFYDLPETDYGLDAYEGRSVEKRRGGDRLTQSGIRQKNMQATKKWVERILEQAPSPPQTEISVPASKMRRNRDFYELSD